MHETAVGLALCRSSQPTPVMQAFLELQYIIIHIHRRAGVASANGSAFFAFSDKPQMQDQYSSYPVSSAMYTLCTPYVALQVILNSDVVLVLSSVTAFSSEISLQIQRRATTHRKVTVHLSATCIKPHKRGSTP